MARQLSVVVVPVAVAAVASSDWVGKVLAVGGTVATAAAVLVEKSQSFGQAVAQATPPG